jgi:Spy/CpxP family protein refolding chaperone
MDEIGLTQDQIDAMEAIRQAAVEALKEVETRQEARDIIQQMRLDIQAVLTEEQLAALAECRQPKRFVTCMDTIGLTQDQIEAIDVIRQAAMEALKEAESPQEARDIIEQMHQAVEDVLTEEQLEALRECLRPKRPVNCMDQIGLTQEQIDAMDAIRELAMEAVQEAQSRQEVREILDQMREDVMAVLTDEQLAALQECRDAHRPRCRRNSGP